MTLQWICDYCGEPIGDGKGYLTISRDVIEMPTRIKAWETLHPGYNWTPPELATYPSSVKWETLHSSCDLEPTGLYVIEVERIRSTTAALEWTAHLMEKGWTKYTDWAGLIRSAVDQAGAAA